MLNRKLQIKARNLAHVFVNRLIDDIESIIENGSEFNNVKSAVPGMDCNEFADHLIKVITRKLQANDDRIVNSLEFAKEEWCNILEDE